MDIRGLRRACVLSAAVWVAGCSGGSTPPPFSDLQLRHLQGKVVEEQVDFYEVERAADIAALLVAPGTWLPPADLPTKIADGSLAHTKGEAIYDDQGNVKSQRLIFPGADATALHGDAQRIFSAKKPGLQAVLCVLTMIEHARTHKSSCGKGEKRFVPPDTLELEMTSDSGVDTEQQKFDAQGRNVSWDNTSKSTQVPAGGHPYDRSRHLITQSYDAAGRAITSHGTENGEQRYNYMLYFDPDAHGNPQRLVDVSSTSADRHDLQAVKQVQLLLMTYTYHDEVR